MTFKILGITDEITACDCCGRTNLRCTVALERADGEIVHYGRDCAGAAVMGRKNARNTTIVERRARALALFATLRADVGPERACVLAFNRTGLVFFMLRGRPHVQLDRQWVAL